MSLIRNNGLSLSDITFDIATTEGNILEQIQKRSGYHHNKEINAIYDEMCKIEYAKKEEKSEEINIEADTTVASRPLPRSSSTLSALSTALSPSRAAQSLSRTSKDIAQGFKNFVKM
jgi:hypothetical protein